MIKLLIPLMLIAVPLWAAEPMSGAAFDAYTRGKTLTYNQGGTPYGVEEYLDGRRVRWSFLDGKCQDGQWYEDAGRICFVYENQDDTQCWSFTQGSGGLVAQIENQSGILQLYETNVASEPMLCLGPDVGV